MIDGTTHFIEFGSEKLPLKIDSIEIHCFILENKKKVFSINSIQKALGYDGKSEIWLLDLLISIQKFKEISEEIIIQFEDSIFVELENIHSKYKTQVADCKTIITVFKIIVAAKNDGYLSLNQLKFAKKAEKILGVITIENIDYKIEEATGFLLYKEQLLSFLDHFLSKNINDDAFFWTKTLPDLFFESLFYQHQLDWKDLKQQPYIIGKFINDLVFSRIPNELLEELRTKKPKRSYKNKDGKPQNNQHLALKEFISNQQSLLKASGYQWSVFLQLLNQVQPKNPKYTTKFPIFPEFERPSEIEQTFFNSILIKGINKE